MSIFKTDSSAVEQDGILAFEFVPSEDLQVQRLPAVRENPFLDYNHAYLKKKWRIIYE